MLLQLLVMKYHKGMDTHKWGGGWEGVQVDTIIEDNDNCHISKSDTIASDVPGLAWAQSLGSGWAWVGSGLLKLKPDPELRAGPGLGLVRLKPGLTA